MGKTKSAATDDARRPFWQSEPCPAWCITPHEDTDHPVERVHHSNCQHQVALALHEPEHSKVGDRVFVDTPVLQVWAMQGCREAEPTVSVVLNDRDHLTLTPAEAVALGKALLSTADMLDGHHTGGA